MKILIVNHYCCLNKGDISILKSMFEALSEVFPDAKFTVTSLYPEIDSARCNAEVLRAIPIASRGLFKKFKTALLMFRCVLWAILRTRDRAFKLSADALIEGAIQKTLKAYNEADMIIARSTDSLTDAYTRSFIISIYQIFFALLLRKRVVIYAQTIGPFKNDLKGRIYKFLTKLVLNKVNLITLREENSLEFLREIGVNKPPIHVTADPAFLLRPASRERVREILSKEGIDKESDKPLIGITVSPIIHRYGFPELKSVNEKYREYIKLMGQVTNYLTDRLGATVVFVPHVFGRGVLPEENDDRIVAKDVYRILRHKHKVRLITDEYTPEELRGIIGQFDLFIGTRMHAIIQALSMYVPTIGIDYTYKVKGVMKMVGQEKWVCHIKTLDFDELISKISAAYLYRDEIRGDLAFKIKVIRECSMLSAKLVKDLMS